MSNLCRIPGCRIRGRHLSECVDEKCSGCLPRLADDGHSCDRCLSLAAQNLESVAEVALAVSDAANRLSAGWGGGGSGKPGSQLPLDLGARSRLDGVKASLYGWARHVAEERGVQLPEVPETVKPPIGPLCRTRYECAHASCKAMRDPEQPPPKLAVVAQWLGKHLDWLAHRPEVDEVFADFAAAARVMRGVVRAPSEQQYLGPCGAEIDSIHQADACYVPGGCFSCRAGVTAATCQGDIYGARGASRGRCRSCGAEVTQDDRQAWLDDQVSASDLAWTASGIAHALHLNAKTIRSWATERRAPNGVMLRRAKLATYWHNGTQLVPWVDPLPGEDVKARGDRLHYVADVARLATEAADRRAAEQARKEQHGEAA